MHLGPPSGPGSTDHQAGPSDPREGVGNGHKQGHALKKTKNILFLQRFLYNNDTMRTGLGVLSSLTQVSLLGEHITFPKRLSPARGKGGHSHLQLVQNHLPPCANTWPRCTVSTNRPSSTASREYQAGGDSLGETSFAGAWGSSCTDLLDDSSARLRQPWPVAGAPHSD